MSSTFDCDMLGCPVALAQAGELEAQCILLGVGFLARDPEHFFGVRSHRGAARRGHLLGQLDHSPGGSGRVEPTVLHGVESASERSVLPSDGVTFKSGTVGGVPGLWVHPAEWRADGAILHLHGGWFNFGSANAYRHLVGQIVARAGARAFIPDYRLAPEHHFPAAVDDVLGCYRGLDEMAIRRIAVTGDSAGGNLALGLASRVTGDAFAAEATLVGVAALSPVTDLTLSGATYETRAQADPYFTRPQVTELVHAYLGRADPQDPRASPLYARLSGLPQVRIHVGDDEILLDDSRRYIERAVAAGVDAKLHLWMGMAHGFPGSVGKLKASAKALDAIGVFLTERFQAISL